MLTGVIDLLTLATYKTMQFHYKTKALNKTVQRMEVDEGNDVVIPCKATQPFVKISIALLTLVKELVLADYSI